MAQNLLLLLAFTNYLAFYAYRACSFTIFPHRQPLQCVSCVSFYLYVFLQNVYYFEILGKIFHCIAPVVTSQDVESVSNKTAGSSCLWLSPSLSAMFRGLCCTCALLGSPGQPPSCQGLTKPSSSRLCPQPGQGRFSRTDCFPHCLLVRNSAGATSQAALTKPLGLHL